ncbi:MAG: hypothetical protein JRC86_00370 [Deltaproteobacteria bacterium]|nr:hypothetical protein [Deltaproteobacteria bacterium]
MAFDAKDADTIKAVKAAVKEAVDEAVETATTGLKDKNTELLGKLKKAKKGQEIDPADHAALETELEETGTKLKTAEKALKTATKEGEASKKLLESESKVSHTLLVDNGLSTALLEAGVKDPAYIEAAKAMLAGQVVLEADGDKRVAKVGDKPLADFVKEWAGSDKGKKFVSAAVNGGGGGGGGSKGGGEKKTMTRSENDALDPAAKMAFFKEGGTLTDE